MANKNITNVQDLYNYAVEQGLKKQAHKILSDNLIKVDRDGKCVETSANASSSKAYMALRRLVDGLGESLNKSNKLTLNEDLFEESIKEGWESIDGLKFTRTGVHGEKLDDDWIDYGDYLVNKNRLQDEMLRDFKEENGYTRADENRYEFWDEFDEFIAERGLEYLDKTVNESLKEGLSKSKKKELLDNLKEASTQLDGALVDFDAYGGEEDKELINELGEISRQLNAFIKKFGNVKIDESIKEDIEADSVDIVFTPEDELLDNGEVVNTEKPDEQTPETPEDNGVAKLILSAINSESDTIAEYNDLIANTDNEDIIRIIQDITAEENNHIGMLQKALELISPNASNIDDGMEEAEGMIDDTSKAESDFTPVAESVNRVFLKGNKSLTEADAPHKKIRKDIKNQYKNWVAAQEENERKRKEMLDMVGDSDDVSDETRAKWEQKVKELYPDEEFKYDFPNNLEKVDYPFYVTYYAEYPIYEPAEGGYYYAGRDAIWSEGFNTEEEAREYIDNYVKQDDQWNEWAETTDGYQLGGKYIGQDQYIVIEPKKLYLSRVSGYEPYQ